VNLILFDEKKFRSLLPSEMLTEKRFVRYFLQDKPGGGTAKIPLGNHSDPATWSTFDECVAALEPGKAQGIGYNFLGGEIFAFDIDHCRNPPTGRICNEAMLLLSRLQGWAEYSVSGQGIHILGFDSVGIRGKQLTETCLQFWHSKKAPRFFALTCDLVGEGFSKLRDWNGQGNYVYADAVRISAKIREELETVDPEQWKSLPSERVKPADAELRPKDLAKVKRRKLHPDFDIYNLLKHYEFAIDHEKDDAQLGRCIFVTSCPIKGGPHTGHNSTTTNFIVSKDGGLGFHCQSTGCQEHGISDALQELAAKHGDYPAQIYEERGKRLPGAILLNHELHRYVEEAEQVLVAREELLYFSRGGDLVKPVLTAEADKVSGLKRDEKGIVIQSADYLTVQRDLSSVGNFQAYSAAKDSYHPAAPTEALAKHVINRVNSGPTGYRRLYTVTQSPCLLPSGDVLDKPGYREAVLYVAGQREFPPIPAEPTRAQAIAALKQFDQLFHRFCFTAENGEAWDKTPSYAATLAAVLSLIARPALPTVPLFGVTARVRGSGKTKLVEAVCSSTIGCKPVAFSFRDEDELEKMLNPLMRGGDRASLIDNISHNLKGDALNAVITSTEFNHRVLGRSEKLRLPNNTVFFATGNNLVIEGDLARRAVLIQLDPGVEQPETLQFDFEPVARAKELYPELVAAALTALRAYIVAGKPWQSQRAYRLGSFEAWDSLISGCLMWAGYADPVLSREQVVQYDPERETALELLQVWHAEFGSAEMLLPKIRKMEGETYRLLCWQESWNPRQIAYRLRRMEGRIISGYKLTRSTLMGGEDRTYWIVSSDKGKKSQATQTSFDAETGATQ
jgi:hypothetical protein